MRNDCATVQEHRAKFSLRQEAVVSALSYHFHGGRKAVKRLQNIIKA